MTTQRTFHTPANIPWFAGRPASAAVRAGDLVFIAGQTSLDESGAAQAPGDVREQARIAFGRIKELVELAGGGMSDVVDLMSFNTDLNEMDAVFDVAREFFPGSYPAWTPMGTTGLPVTGLKVSIRAIAHVGPGEKECVVPDTLKWWRDLPMSAGCKKGDLVFVAGQVAADAEGNVTVPGDHAAQARFGYNRIREIIEHFGGDWDDIIDVITFNQDARGMVPAAGVQREYFEHIDRAEVPAWTAIGMTGFYKLGMLSSWRAIADLSAGPRIAKTPDSIWWKIDPISGGTRKTGGTLIGMAGQVASDGDGEITTPGDVAGQARYALNRLKEVLEEFGVGMDSIVEVTSFHKDPRAWEIVMDVGRQYFGDDGPAWTAAGSTGLFKEGYLHEIHALAVV